MHRHLVAVLLLQIYACGDAAEDYRLSGRLQKGPFVAGTAVSVQPLAADLSEVGEAVQAQVTDALGTYEVSFAERPALVRVRASGFYYDEVSGFTSDGRLTLDAVLIPPDAGCAANVNALMHLARPRLERYTVAGDPAEVARAKAEQETLAAFGIGIGWAERGAFSTWDLGGSTDGDAILLALSASLQSAAAIAALSGGTTAELSRLLGAVASDLDDGDFDDADLKEEIRHGTIELDVTAVRANLEAYYREKGEGVTVGSFERFVDSDGDGILPE